ncbi:MAG: hypothetical protein HY791_38445 [Deltaproteobacteria bacterium]|nr:hypothetical protein [Deltaproteobacteria bacterium]
MATFVRVLGLSSALVFAACQPPPLDTSRDVPERGTLGQEIFGLFHRDFERETPRRAEGFAIEQEPFVGVIDHLFPEDELRATQEYLVRLLPLYDDSTIPIVTRTLAATIERLEGDEAALRALAAVLYRQGYVDRGHEEALARRIVGFAKYRELTKELIEFALDHDGLDGRGEPDPNEVAPLGRLQSAFADGLRELEISEDAERDIVLAADLMLKEDPRFSVGDAPVLTAGVVARDVRGMAKVQTVGGRVPAPFSDSQGDGVADLDDAGRFVDTNGVVVTLDPYGDGGDRDANGRLLMQGGATVYRYVELENTLLVGLLRDSRSLVLDGTIRRSLDVVEALLGERTPEDKYGATNSPILDAAHALAVTLDTDDVPDILETFQKLMRDHEDVMGWNLVELETQLDISDRYDVALKPENRFFDDMMSVLRRILNEPGLAEAVIDALEDDAVLGLPEAQALLSEFKHPLITHEDFENQRIFATRVDYTKSDSRDNQSLQQRLMHLIYDTRGVRFEPRIIGIPAGFIFEISDLAEFYLLSTIGVSTVPSLVSTLTGLDEHPTPEQLAVFINEDSSFGNPVGKDGIEVRLNDGDTLFAASASGITAALRPLVQAFYDHGRLDLLFDLFEVLHLHWATVEGGDYQGQNSNDPKWSKLSGLRRYEPMLMDVFRNTKVMEGTRELMRRAGSTRTASGRDGRTLLLSFVRRFMGKDLELRTRDGASEVVIDGERVSPLSPFDLVRYARSRLKSQVRRTASTQQAYEDLVDALHDHFLATVRTGPKSGEFDNPRAKPVTLTLLGFLEERARRHAASGALRGWIRTEIPKFLEDAITSTELPAAIDLIHLIEANPALDGMMTEMRDELLDEARGFPDLVVVLADLLNAAKDASVAAPLLRFLGNELHPNTRLTFDMLNFASDAIHLDPEEHTLEVMRRSLESAPFGGLFAYGLSGAIRQTNRTNPLEVGPLSKADVVSVLAVVRRYLLDDQHGMEKFYKLVENRK